MAFRKNKNSKLYISFFVLSNTLNRTRSCIIFFPVFFSYFYFYLHSFFFPIKENSIVCYIYVCTALSDQLFTLYLQEKRIGTFVEQQIKNKKKLTNVNFFFLNRFFYVLSTAGLYRNEEKLVLK